MLELEVVPERSLGCENWEFILGKQKSLPKNYVWANFWLITKEFQSRT
jgi:hypothetical protein